MNQMSKKMGFWAVFSLVVNSQIGSGILLLPAVLAPYGLYSIAGWLTSTAGAIALALVFAQLCSWIPETGGAHTYVRSAFGPTAAFFTGWTYWVISWVSTTVVVIECVAYLVPLIGQSSSALLLTLELLLLALVTYLNVRGVELAGKAELYLTILKVVPLLAIPLAAFFCFNAHNFAAPGQFSTLTLSAVLGRTTMLTLWCFIGLESATAPANAVYNASRTIPRAIIIGTLCVALIYLLNSLAIMGAVPAATLAKATVPYADVAQYVFGGNWSAVVAIIAFLICLGTFNAWVLTSGQIALGLAQDGILPPLLSKKNSYGSPALAILLSSAGMAPLLIMTAHSGLVSQVIMIVDLSVTAFLFVYLICSFSFLKLLLTRHTDLSRWRAVPGAIAIGFCCWVIHATAITTLASAAIFTLSGLPLYFYMHRKRGVPSK